MNQNTDHTTSLPNFSNERDSWKKSSPSVKNDTKNKRFSVVETEKWKNVFVYPRGQEERGEVETSSHAHDPEDAQWREIFGCQTTYRDRVVSVPLPINPEKINGFVKRKSDPVQLPSSRRVSVLETEKWKNMFACDARLESRSAPAAQSIPGDESWRQFFGCQPDSTSTPLSSSPLKSLGQISKQNRSPQIHLSTIPERDTETGSSSNGSGELPKPKLMTYLRSIMKSKAAKKKQSKSHKWSSEV
jgi:hypothetical protein